MIFSTRPDTLKTVLHYAATADDMPARPKPATFAWSPVYDQNARDYSDRLRGLDGESVTLELQHVFANQWNTAEGLRVFDSVCYREYSSRKPRFVYGQYLDITPEMIEVRNRIHVCGYCGANYWDCATYWTLDSVCTACIGSEYLDESRLHLLQLVPVARENPKRQLDPATLATLVERFRAEQISATSARDKARQVKQRANIVAKATDKIRVANIERDGLLWLLDRGVRIDNCIYYSHTSRFCFGWRKPLSAGEHSTLLDLIGAEFPFDYDVKTA